MTKTIKVETQVLGTLTVRRLNALDRIIFWKAIDNVAGHQTPTNGEASKVLMTLPDFIIEALPIALKFMAKATRRSQADIDRLDPADAIDVASAVVELNFLDR